ncbi:MAG: hypothetical protein U0V72_05900 [Cytophagales bacterium]
MKIKRGEIKDRAKERAAEEKIFNFKTQINKLEIENFNNNIKLEIEYSDTLPHMVLDTAILHFVKFTENNNILKITLDTAALRVYEDQQKALDELNNQKNNGGFLRNSTRYESYAVEDGYSTYHATIYIPCLSGIQSYECSNIEINTYKNNQLKPIQIDLDGSTLNLNYIDVVSDSLGNETHITQKVVPQITAIQKNSSTLKFSNFRNIPLHLTLINNYFEFENYDSEDSEYGYTQKEFLYKDMVIKYDKYSDINFNLSEMKKIKLIPLD